MPTALQRHLPWIAVWAVGTLVWALILGRIDIAQQRDAFDAATRAVVPLLEQRLAANDAALAGLAQAPGADARTRIVQRLVQTHPQVIAVLQREPNASWGDQGLNAAEQRSLASRQIELAHVNLPKGRYAMVLAAEPVSFALQIDFNAMVNWADWPVSRFDSPIRIEMAPHTGQDAPPNRATLVLQPGKPPGNGWFFGDAPPDSVSDRPTQSTTSPATTGGTLLTQWQIEFSQPLKSASQKFVVTATRQIGLADLPWSPIANGSLLLALLLLAARALMRQRHDRLRAGELLRIGQLGRLNTLSELAAGMSRELKGPLASALAASQAAQQQLAQEPLERAGQIEAMVQNTLAEEDLHRANNIIQRLNHVVERPDLVHRLTAVNLGAAMRHTLDVLQPELRRVGVQPRLVGPDIHVMADYSALQQIIHQLVMNALQAMQDSPSAQRQLTLTFSTNARPGSPDSPSSADFAMRNTLPAALDPPGPKRDEGTRGAIATGDNRRPIGPAGPVGPASPVGHITPQGRLSVQDTGPGLDNRVLTHIFEPFFTTRQDGLGLGLSLCETFAHAMGGSLTAFNHPPHGAEFCLSLRLAD